LKAGTHPLAGLYYLTGSSPSLLDDHVKESLAGRCHIFNLHGLSVKEILKHFEVFPLKRIMLMGGFPELYMNSQLVPQQYLNDYIISFIEKDIARSSGIEKIAEFHTVLRLLAARSGQLISFSEVATLAGVDQKTVMWWTQLLQRNFILELVPTYSSNLSKRITKQKKLYFFDVGICSRLQGHQTEDQIWNSSQLGGLFETLVFSEIAKTKSNFLIDWQVYTWRTHDQAEVDFILHYKNSFIFIEAKVAIHGAKAFQLDREAIKVFKGHSVQKIVVTAGGEITQLDQSTKAVPIQVLGDYLIKIIETM
jgi:predicted AAA+ superfamily ATPase